MKLHILDELFAYFSPAGYFISFGLIPRRIACTRLQLRHCDIAFRATSPRSLCRCNYLHFLQSSYRHDQGQARQGTPCTLFTLPSLIRTKKALMLDVSSTKMSISC